MSKTVKMRTIVNEDRETGNRADIQTGVTDNAEASNGKDARSHERLDAIAKFMADKKDDQLAKDYGIHPVHSNVIREMSDKKAKQKPVHFSDGTHEMLWLVHKKLVAAGRL